MTRAGFSFRRLAYLGHHALREAVRQKILCLLVLLALGFVLGAQEFREFHFGSPELKFIADLGLGAEGLFGTVLAVVVTAQLFFSEIEQCTVQTLLAKPVGRVEFILGKFLAQAVLLAAYCALLTGLLAAVLWMRETHLLREVPGAFTHGRMIRYGQLLAAGWLLWLKLLMLSALTLLVAAYARTQLFTVVMGFLVFVICHWQHFAQFAAARAGATPDQIMTAWVACALPDFQLFDLADTFPNSGPLPWGEITRVSLYALGYITAANALAVFCFGHREI